MNLKTKYKANLRGYLRNNLLEIYLRNYLQDMLVNFKKDKNIKHNVCYLHE